MGFKFRKSFKIAPGVKVNVSKKGIGTSVGGKYARVSTSSRGTTVGGSIPGTGVSYSKTTGKGKKSAKGKNQQAGGCLSGCLGCFGLIFIIGILLAACTSVFEDDPQSDDVAETKETETATAADDDQAVPTADPEDTENNRFIAATVLSVTDGDTIKVDLDGKEESVRLILVDTPETKHPQLGKQPLGEEASAFTKEQLSGKEIQIEPGVEERDQYGRLLAYVYVGDKMFNKTLVEEGLARVAVYPPNTKYLDELETAQAAAKEQGIGIWEVENYATEDGYDAAVYEPDLEPEPVAVEPEPTPEPVIEEPVAQVESFQNCTALRAVYPDGVPSDHPAYASKHDRDKDNWACEQN